MTGERFVDIARRFNVSPELISMIARHKIWRVTSSPPLIPLPAVGGDGPAPLPGP